ncbi:MAG: DUF389 domain-containing protein [Synechococcaceae cyanobacterium RL_1_2]|nr:DUF389 domain-containing protein [Synechococcaceae cyanobacterium RL_1_2]
MKVLLTKIDRFLGKYYRYCRNWILHFWERYTTRSISEKLYRRLYRELLIEASWTTNYVVFTVTACLIATFGLISNSTAVIIGAMLIAPLMLPLRGLAFAALEGEFFLFKRAFFSITGATTVAIALSWLIGLVVNLPDFGSEVLARTQPNLIDLGIAIVAGAISGYAKVKKGVSDALAGTAIAVALMPPLCVVGLCLSQGFLSLSWGSFLLYLTNLLGIALACMVVFILFDYTAINRTLGWTLALTTLLIVPLGFSFVRLVRYETLEKEITQTLVNKTITVGRGVSNTKIEVVWTEKPTLVYVLLQTNKTITPEQTRQVENFVSKRMGQEFQIVFLVNQIQQVTGKDPDPTPKQLEDIQNSLPTDELETLETITPLINPDMPTIITPP